MPAYEALESRLARKIDRSGDCWVWTAAVDSAGYGRVWHDGQMQLAHRVTYSIFVEPIQFGLSIDHACHNADESCEGGKGCPHRKCVNPAHLEAVTQGENARRGRTGQRSGQMQRAKTHCGQGHAYDAANTYVAPNGSRACRICRRQANRRYMVRRAS